MIWRTRLGLWRFWLVCLGLALLPVLLLWHLARLQALPGEERGYRFLQNQGAARTQRNELLMAYRGVITDRSGELLAVSTPMLSLWANPSDIVDSEVVEIAKAFGQPKAWLQNKLARYSDKQFVYLERLMAPYAAEKILHMHFSGIAAETEYRRYYPAGEVAAHVVGFTDTDDRGREGVELAFNDWLAGFAGKKRVVKDLKGNVVRDLGLLTAPKPGKDVQLSIDLKLQYLAYRELKKAIAARGAKSGSVVLLDVATNEVLAMANQPSYNPNDRSQIKPQQMRNRAVTDVFEPGSTVKPFTIATALESGKYRPTDTVDTSPGYVRVEGKTLLDPVNYGVINLTKVLTKSSQVGVTKIALTLDPTAVRDMFFRVGFGQNSGIGFPGENDGLLPSRQKWSDIERANFAFGYGLNTNALQLAHAYSVIANGGEDRPITLVRGTQAVPAKRVLSLDLSRELTQMLKTIPQKGGTGTRAQIDAYPVAGKTGTAHKVGGAGYIEDKYVAVFAGFAPADNPKVVAVVVVNEPPASGDYSGGKVAAPIFAAVVSSALKAMNVAPQNTKKFLAQASGEIQ